MQSDPSELSALEQQLSHPSGEKGIEVADMMHATNIGMTCATIMQLGLLPEHHVLELGHGNCGHLELLLEQAPRLHYTGLEISETMQQEALRLNAARLAGGNIRFERYDGSRIPFASCSFDRMFAVNSLYFWPEPQALLREIHRVLKPGGLAAITYADKSFMQRLPFVQQRFRLYDDSDFSRLIDANLFAIRRLHREREQIRTKSGDLVERDFSVALLRKK